MSRSRTRRRPARAASCSASTATGYPIGTSATLVELFLPIGANDIGSETRRGAPRAVEEELGRTFVMQVVDVPTGFTGELVVRHALPSCTRAIASPRVVPPIAGWAPRVAAVRVLVTGAAGFIGSHFHAGVPIRRERSRLLEPAHLAYVALVLVVCILVGAAVVHGYLILLVAAAVASSMLWSGLRHPLVAAQVLLVASALYFPIKLALPPTVNSVWLDAVVGLSLGGWLLRWISGGGKVAVSHAVGVPVALLLAWGVIEALRAPDLLFGAYGFRAIFTPFMAFWLFAAAVSSIEQRSVVLKTIVVLGCAVATYCVLEFVLLNAHLASPGSWIDLGRAEYMQENAGFVPSLRFGLIRSLGLWPDPSQAALYLVGALGIATHFISIRRTRRWALLCVGLLVLGLASTLSTWPIVVAAGVLAIAAGIHKQGRIPERMTLIVALAVVGWVLVGILAPAPLRDPQLRFDEVYSTTTVLENTSNLQEALGHFDLLGRGLYDVPASQGYSDGSLHAADALGNRYFFLDDLVRQVGLIGISMLLALWMSAVVVSYARGSRWGPDRVLLGVALSLAGLFLASQHYGAPLIYGVNYVLVALMAVAATPPRRPLGGMTPSSRTQTAAGG
jgi:hypothetical protein